MADDLPATPRDTYRRIIDQFVGGTSGVTAKRILDNSPLPDDTELETVLASLTPDQRTVIARLCDSERHGAMHDLLACLTWWIDCGGVSLTHDGEPMPVDESGMGLHGDYVGRSQDWDWPDSN